MTLDPYAELNIPRTASPADIATAYRRAAKINHPDTGGSKEKFSRLSQSVAILRDPDRRARYDETGDTTEAAADPDAAALQHIQQAIEAQLKDIRSDFVHTDILANASNMLQTNLTKLQGDIQGHDLAISRMEQAIKRAKSRVHKKNRLQPIFTWQLNQIRMSRTRQAAAATVLSRALQILADHTYTVDPQKPQQFAHWTTASTY